MTKEIWRDIQNYEGLYQVSNLGRVKSLNRVSYRQDGTPLNIKGKIMRLSKNTYLYARLQKDGENKHLAVHRLVAEAFIPNPNQHPCVNHKDYNPLNNSIDNLEWCTYSYNNNYGEHSKRLSDSMVEKYGKKIDVYDKYGNLIKSYDSIRDAVNDGYTRDSISKCCRGELNSHCGLVFRYKDEPFIYKNRRGNVIVEKYDLQGNLVCTYLTIASAALDNNLKKDKLKYMRNNSISKPVNGFIYKFR